MFDGCYENMTLTINQKKCPNIMNIIPDTVKINDINQIKLKFNYW